LKKNEKEKERENMSISSDGATVRRERLLDMLRYLRGFMPKGISLNSVQLYMSISHGLTYKTSQRYVYELDQGGVISFNGGLIRVNNENFKAFMKIMAPDRDPETGDYIRGLYLQGTIDLETEPEAVILEKKTRKTMRDMGVV